MSTVRSKTRDLGRQGMANGRIMRCVKKVLCAKMTWLAFLALSLFLLGIGSCMYSDMDFTTAAYVMAQVITTIGYGDITPKTNLSKLCVSAYCLASLVIMAYVLNEFVDALMAWQEKHVVKAADTGGKCGCLRDIYFLKMVRGCVIFLAFLSFGTVFYTLQENCTCGYGSTKGRVIGCDPTNYNTCVATGGSTKTFIDSFYMSVITLTSVGFGDFHPDSWRGRAVGFFWMIFGVVVTGNWVSSMTAFLFERNHAQLVKHEVNSDELLMYLDTNDDGKLERCEHHLYWMVMQGVLSQKTTKELDIQFNTRSDDGMITFQQLLAEAIEEEPEKTAPEADVTDEEAPSAAADAAVVEEGAPKHMYCAV